MKIDDLARPSNLLLAWQRITTGGNSQYKNLYRTLYGLYGISLDDNLRDLGDRLRAGIFEPTAPERIMLPKASGLHRPISLLNIEDQIVLQAFANLVAKKIRRTRSDLELQVVFSNVLQDAQSKFFFRKWQFTYGAFKGRIDENYHAGRRWVGDFDLASFYDTISHELLLEQLYPRTNKSELEWIASYLKQWSSGRKASQHGHGLPQGPIASDLLAEAFLLPIDKKLRHQPGYLRYVDDVRLLGRTEDEVRAQLIELESHCREHGLIPQVGKFSIRKATSVAEAVGMLPSIADPHHADDGDDGLTGEQAQQALRGAFEGKPRRVVDKTRLRYVLFRAEPDSQILKIVLNLLPLHPEHSELFFTYLSRFGYRKPIEDLCLQLIEESPYPYVKGEAWQVLARYLPIPKSQVKRDAYALGQRAIAISKVSTQDFSLRLGVCRFLCVSEAVTGARHTEFIRYQPPLLQAMLGSDLPPSAVEPNRELARAFLARTSFEPGLSISPEIARSGAGLAAFGLNGDPRPQVINTLRSLGAVSGDSVPVDGIAEVLRRRFGLQSPSSWHDLFTLDEYRHAQQTLVWAQAEFEINPSHWLMLQNAFNDLAYRALQRHLNATSHPAACKTVDRNGQIIDFGIMMDASQRSAQLLPTIATCFREMNTRRNRLPAAHAFDKRSGQLTRILTRPERNKFINSLRSAYADFSVLMPASGSTS